MASSVLEAKRFKKIEYPPAKTLFSTAYILIQYNTQHTRHLFQKFMSWQVGFRIPNVDICLLGRDESRLYNYALFTP